MAEFKFPENDYDKPEAFYELPGTFWTDTFEGREQIISLLSGRILADKQAADDFKELLDSMSRLSLPVFSKRRHYRLKLIESEESQDAGSYPKYDGTYTYSSRTTIRYGLALENKLFSWSIPQEIKDAKVITSSLFNPSAIYVRGVDFKIEDGTISFYENPFSNDNVEKEGIYSGGKVVDRTASLWMHNVDIDKNDLPYKQFGYVLGFKLKASKNYLKLINAYLDGLAEGTTSRSIEDAFEAMADAAIAKENGEVVERVVTDSRNTVIITDKNVYIASKQAKVLVSVGDTLTAGQSLTDAVQFFEFNRGKVPSEVRALSLSPGFLAHGYFNDLVFENKTVPLQVSTEDGYTRVEFEIGGNPDDVKKFWDSVHKSGIEAGETLAHLLDTRTNKSEEPTELNLPKEINPLEFLISNFFYSSLTVALVKPTSFGSNAIGMWPARFLRKLVPPHTALVILTELVAVDDKVIMDGPGSATSPGYVESVTSYSGVSVSETVDVAQMVKETIRTKSIAVRCN